MASKYYAQHPERSPLADTGMIIALAVTIVTVLKLLMYGITYVSVLWLTITLVYILSTTVTDANSSIRKGMTVFYICVSVIAFFAAFSYDKPIKPKTESNMKADGDDEFVTNDEEEQTEEEIKVETPKPVVVETDNIVQEDASTFEEVSPNLPTEEYPTAVLSDEDDVEVIDLHSDESNSVGSTTQQDVQYEPEINGSNEFDDTFQ